MAAYFTRPLSTLTKRYRIFYEESAELMPRDERGDMEELRNKRGETIYRYSQDLLALSSDTPYILNQVLAHVQRVQRKAGSVVVFPEGALSQVCRLVRPYVKKQMTEEQRAIATARLRAFREKCK